MALLLNQDQLMLKDTIGSFLRENGGVEQLRQLRDSGDRHGYSKALLAELGELGVIGILAPETSGGLGLGHVEMGLVAEELGRTLTAGPLLQTSVGAVTALCNGQATLRDRWLPEILTGQSSAACAISPTGETSLTNSLRATASARGGYVLSGSIERIAFGQAVDLLIARGVLDGRVALFAIDLTARGINCQAERLIDSSWSAELTFDHVELVDDCLLTEPGPAAEQLDGTLHSALTLAGAAELIGVAREAFDRTIAYLKERKQFEARIGSFQALQHRAAHLYCEIEVARASVFKAQRLLDAKDAGSERAVAVAKATADLAAGLAVQEAVQLHGGIGMTDELDIGLFMKRAKVLSVEYGSADVQIDWVARNSSY